MLGAAFLGWSWLGGPPTETLEFTFLGVMVLAVGLLHIFGGFKPREERSRHRLWIGLLLGLYEIVLRVLLTGRNHHSVGLSGITEMAASAP